MEGYRILDWDTDFFGFKVAFLTLTNPDIHQLKKTIDCLRQNDVKLAYWSSQNITPDIKYNIEQMNGYLVDKKTTFTLKTENVERGKCIQYDILEPYCSTINRPELEALAIHCGKYSRFAIDPKIPYKKFMELYTIWINRSIKKEIADEVFVIREQGKTVGVVTVSGKGEKGYINLIAVDENMNGKGYGEILVRGAQHWFITQGYNVSQVVTQWENIPACNLYRKCGYSLEKIDFFYHLWL